MDVDFLTGQKTLISEISHISDVDVLLYFSHLVSLSVVLDAAKPPLAVSLEMEEFSFHSLR